MKKSGRSSMCLEMLLSQFRDEPTFKDKDGVLYSRDWKRLLRCDNLGIREYCVRWGTQYVCGEAFEDCAWLCSIYLPVTVNGIGPYAFSRCTSLVHVSLPPSVHQIGDRAFSNCLSLRMVSIGNKRVSLGNYVFMSCNSLQKIYFY